jgi:hypothetical protein
MKLQFSLRSLMIVVTLQAVPFAYIGWEAKIVRERRELLNWITQTGGKAYPLVSEQVGRYGEVPLLRRLLGDKTIGAIKLDHPIAPEQRQSIQQCIPEAEIWPTYVREERLREPMSGTGTSCGVCRLCRRTMSRVSASCCRTAGRKRIPSKSWGAPRGIQGCSRTPPPSSCRSTAARPIMMRDSLTTRCAAIRWRMSGFSGTR